LALLKNSQILAPEKLCRQNIGKKQTVVIGIFAKLLLYFYLTMIVHRLLAPDWRVDYQPLS